MTKYNYEEGKTYTSDTEPTEIVLIPAGGYRYRIVAEGYDTVEGRVDAIQGTKELNVQMTLTVYNLSVQTVTGGSIKASSATATMGQTITLTPTAAAGYHFKNWSVTKAGGAAVTVTNNQFVMPASDVTISAVFELTVFNISVVSGLTGGFIKASAATAVMGTQITLTAAPSTGYELVSWSVNGPSGAVTVSNNKFTMPAGAVTVSATFRLISYSITINQVEGGTISASAAAATMGQVVTLSVSLKQYYELASWVVTTAAGASVTVTNNKFTMPAGNVTVSATYNKLRQLVGFELNRNTMSSNPETCLTYVEDAVGLTPMSAASEGGWADRWPFNQIRPVVLNSNGSVHKYLDKTNLSKYEDGSSAAADLASDAYDAYTEFPKIYYKVVVNGNVSTMYLCNVPETGYKVHPAFVVDGAEKDKIYIGRYLAYLTNNKLYSRSKVIATASTTRPTFRAAAQARGAGFNLISYYDWYLVATLYTLAFKNLHGQNALGAGRTNASNYIANGETDSQKWTYGTTSVTAMISLFGLENWWGEKLQFIDNFISVDRVAKAGQLSKPNDTGSGYDTVRSYGSNIYGAITTVAGGDLDFFLCTAKGSNYDVGLCDHQDLGNSGTALAYVGGSRGNESNAGPFCCYATNAVSASIATIGSRLAYKP